MMQVNKKEIIFSIEGCNHIASKFELERQAKDLRALWQEENRNKGLRSLSQRHNAITEMEKRIGVKRRFSRPLMSIPYAPVIASVSPLSGGDSQFIASQTPKKLRLGSTHRSSKKEEELTSRLNQPKGDYCLTNEKLHSDYRGMIHTDYREALENLSPWYAASVTPNATGSELLGRASFSSACKRREKQSSTQQNFPFPAHSLIGSPLSPDKYSPTPHSFVSHKGKANSVMRNLKKNDQNPEAKVNNQLTKCRNIKS